MKYLYYLLTLLIGVIPTTFFAQLSEKAVPKSAISTNQLPIIIDKKTMPAINPQVLQIQDQRDAENGLPPKFGHPFDVSLNLQNSGTWSTLPNGDQVWQLTIVCPNALSINFLYDQFWMPEGGQFFIYNKNKTQTIGAFTNKNNKPDRKFGTGLVYGEEVTLEYYEPKAVKNQGSISINTVIHGYRYIRLEDNFRGYEDAAACQVNTICAQGAGWENEIKSVALMLLGPRYCTGTLLNNADENCQPLLLTSNACLSSYDAINNPVASGFTFYWRYESPNCANGGVGNEGTINETTNGAFVLANSGLTSQITDSDFALLELIEDPNANYDVYYAGWDRNPSAPNNMAAIHHPLGDVKKISLDNGTAFTSGFVVPGSTHWLIFNWETGIMEDGSNGAPLFNSAKRFVGQHSGGLSNCGNPMEDYFGRLSYSWNNNGATDPRRRLRDWLDPSNINTMVQDGIYSPCNPRPIISFSTAFTTVEEVAVIEPNCIGYQEFTVDLEINAAPAIDATALLTISGSANSGAINDYTISSSSLVFPAGSDASQSIVVRVYDDAYVEGPEQIDIQLSVSTAGRTIASLSNFEHTINIIDNDWRPELNGPLNTYDIMTEDFEDGAFPANWTKTSVGGGAMAFMYGTAVDIGDVNSFFTVNPSNTTNMVGSNDDTCNCDMSDDNLISPMIDLSLVSYAEARLHYDAYFEGLPYAGYSESAEVYLSSDGGTTWELVDEIPAVGADGPWQTRMVDLATALGSNTVKVKFRYSDNGGFLFGLCIDNVRVEVGDRLPCNIQVPDNSLSLAEKSLGPMETVHYYDEITGDVMLSIENTSNHDYGCISVEVDRSGTTYSSNIFNSNNSAYFLASKTFMVTPEFNLPNGSYNIKLYYTEAEILGWETATSQSRNAALIVKTNTNISTITPANYLNYTIEGNTATFAPYSNSTSAVDGIFSASFATGFSGFGVGVLDQTLSVDLLSFTGKRENRTAVLSWETESEVNNDYFTLEHSMDGIDYRALAMIQGAGNSTTPKSYRYVDENPYSGVNYYRLSLTDFSGERQDGGVVSVNFEALDYLEIFPNPVRDNLVVSIASDKEEDTVLYVYDAAGKLIMEQQIIINPGNNLFPVTMNGLPAGLYLLEVEQGKISKTRKFMKM